MSIVCHFTLNDALSNHILPGTISFIFVNVYIYISVLMLCPRASPPKRGSCKSNRADLEVTVFSWFDKFNYCFAYKKHGRSEHNTHLHIYVLYQYHLDSCPHGMSRVDLSRVDLSRVESNKHVKDPKSITVTHRPIAHRCLLGSLSLCCCWRYCMVNEDITINDDISF